MTKNIKQYGLAAAFAVTALCGAQAAAAPLILSTGDTITLGYDGGSGPANGDPYGGGGFRATGVSVLNGSSGSFITFCLEYPEHIALNTSYYVKLNSGAVDGGYTTGGTYPGDANGGTQFDPLSHATAWLVTQFYNGNLSGFSQANPNDFTSLQLAIWHLEGELVQNLNNPAWAAYNGDLKAQGWVSSAIGAGWTNNGQVMVLNLYDTYRNGVFSGNHQDQIYMSPVPEPETYAMLLAGLGLLGWSARRRKQTAE